MIAREHISFNLSPECFDQASCPDCDGQLKTKIICLTCSGTGSVEQLKLLIDSSIFKEKVDKNITTT